MTRIHILVEGYAEERFVKDMLAPYLSSRQIYLATKSVVTKFVEAGPNYKGGISHYNPVKRDLQRLSGDSSALLVTTMIDFYGLPDDFPKPVKIPANAAPHHKVRLFEEAFGQEINNPKFLPYLSLYEFESLLFAEPEMIAASLMGEDKQKKELQKIRDQFETPEHINDNYETAPSRRITRLFPSYKKPLYGSLISRAIGLERIRAECPHFNQWLQKLESLVEEK